MEHRLYHIDSYLCKAGSPVTDLIIVAEGEGFVDIEVETEPLISSPQKHSLPPLPPLSPEALPTLGEAPISSPSSVIQPDPMCVVPPPAVTSHGEKSTDGKTNKPHEQRENSSHSPPNPNHSPSKHSRLSKHTALKSIPSPKKGSKEKIALGRIGPGAVIGLEIAHCSSFVEEVCVCLCLLHPLCSYCLVWYCRRSLKKQLLHKLFARCILFPNMTFSTKWHYKHGRMWQRIL